MGQWTTLASRFPATLVKDTPPDLLVDGQTPDAYGMGIDKPGVLYTGSIAAGTDPAKFTSTATPTNYTPLTIPTNKQLFYIDDRLWLIATSTDASNTAFYFAPGYDAEYYTHGFPKVICDDDSGNLVWAQPCAGGVVLFKAGSIYFVPSTREDGPRGFKRLLVVQSLSTGGLSATTDCCYYNGAVFWNNANGVFSFDGREIKEWTEPIRGTIGNFTAADLNGDNDSGIDYVKRRIIANDATKKYVVDTTNGNLYDYTTSGFRWTSRTLTDMHNERLLISGVRYHLQHNAGGNKSISAQIMKPDGNWYPAETVKADRTSDEHGTIDWYPTDAYAQEKWAMRITGLDSNLYIHQIDIMIEQGQPRPPSSQEGRA